MAAPPVANDFAQTFSKPGVSDTASLALPPPSTNVSAQTSPVKIVAGVRFGGVEAAKSDATKSFNSSNILPYYAQSSSDKKEFVDSAAMAIPASTATSQQTSPVKETPITTPPTWPAQKTVVDRSSIAILPSTTTSQQTSPVKKSMSQSSYTAMTHTVKAPAAATSEESKKNFAVVQPKPLKTPTAPLSPRMAQYGQGNTYNPSTPSLYMKTHNVRAPQDQVYPHTISQKSRVAEYDRETLTPHPQGRPPSTLPDPTQILYEYKKAAHLVAAVQIHFKSEYSRAFINWSRPWSQIKKELLSSEGMETSGGGRFVDPVDMRVAGLSSGLAGREKVLEGKEAVHPVLMKKKNVSIASGSEGGNKDPVDFTRVQSIYQSLQKKKY